LLNTAKEEILLHNMMELFLLTDVPPKLDPEAVAPPIGRHR
jgi:hypothetical protein